MHITHASWHVCWDCQRASWERLSPLPCVHTTRGDCKSLNVFLLSVAGIQGTNRPVKHSVLMDEVGFTADSMQLLVHWLCHTFCRCTR